MNAPAARARAGFVLLPVVLLLALLATVAFLVAREGSLGADAAARLRDAREARLVAQAGLAHARWAADASACSAYALADTDFGDHSYRAVFTPTSGSPVSIAATGTLADGTARTLARSGVRVYDIETTTELQPDAAQGKDAWFTAGKPDWNYGAHANLEVNALAGQRSGLAFDLSAIPANAQVRSAVLALYANDAQTGGDVTLHRFTDTWLEGSCAGAGCPADGITWDWRDGATPWATPGGDFDAVPAASATVAAANAWHAFDLTALVAAWVAGAQPNEGVLVRGTGSTNVTFTSSDHADATLHPKLTVTYACECGGGPALTKVLQPPGPGGFDTYLNDGQPGNNYGGDASLDVSNKTNSKDRPVIRFGLKSIPAGAIVSAATLELNLESIGSGGVASVDVHRVMTSWKEDAATWNAAKSGTPWTTPGGDFDPTVIATAGIDAALPGPTTWDITALVAGWVGGSFANHGLLLMGSSDVNNARFSSSDHADASLHPKLTVTYSCPCGVVCTPGGGAGGDGNALLMVVVNPAGLTAQEALKKSLIESWGYAVELIDESAAQSAFDNAVATNDVVFVSEDVTASNVGTKLTGAPIGVVIEEVNLSDDLGLAQSVAWESGTVLEVNDNTHYITAPFAPGLLTVLSVSESLAYVTGTLAPGLSQLASSTSGFGLIALEAGAETFDAGPAAGRRAQLPWGGNAMDVSHLTDDGATLFRRALEWSAGAVLPPQLLMIVGDPASLTPQQTDKKALIESWGYAVNFIATSEPQSAFDTAAASADVVYLPELGSTPMSELGGKADDLATGVVTEESRKALKMGSFLLDPFIDADSITVTDNTHYITETLPLGTVAISTAVQTLWELGGTLAPDLQTLGELTGNVPGLAVLEKGALRNDSSPAPARRAKLPWGAFDFDINLLTSEGLAIFKRALEWAAEEPPVQVAVAVSAPNDDAEEAPFGVMYLDSTDLELVEDGAVQTIGIRFASVPVPPGATVESAHIDFTVDELGSGATSLTIHAEDADAPPAFTATAYDITSRTLTTTSVDWPTVPPWETAHEIQTSPDVSALVQGLVDRPGWIIDNPMVFVITGSGTRTAEAYEGEPTMTPVLRIEYRGGSGGGGGGGDAYTEALNTWAASTPDNWETVDLSAFGVPANAVVEVAVVNGAISAQRWGGVRAVGSTLERRILLHEAESGGVDAVVLHVQTDASAQIQHYSDNTGQVSFVLLGWWTGATYEERFQTFKAGASGSWQTRDLSGWGVDPDQVTEIVATNSSTLNERLAGARRVGFAGDRWANLHEAEGGGVDAGTMLVTASTGGDIEVYAQADGDIDFYLVGFFSTAPGTYTELPGTSYWQAAGTDWEDHDVTAFGVPANSVVSVLVANLSDTAESNMGVRATGSSLKRYLQLHEAESGGRDVATWHVQTDPAGLVQSRSDIGGSDFRFYPTGFWTFP